jgi:predicted RNase H-like nuclease (RuvC/YqgF family)
MYLCFKQGFDIKKYGFLGETEQEKIVEVPVEIIKEVEKIVEVPVEKVVTKIEYINDKSGENELLLKIQQLESEMSKKDLDLDELRRKLDDPVTNNNINMLQNTLQKLRGELSEKNQKIKELEQINKGLLDGQQTSGAYLLRGSNLNKRV